MKILCKNFDCALYFIMTGWANVFTNLGHEWIWWNPQEKCAFDIFSEVEPDIYIGTTYDLDRATIKCITARPNMKVVMKSNNWGELDDQIDTTIYPIGIAKQQEKDLICDLRSKIGKPDLIFNFYHPNKMYGTMNRWEENGVKTISMLQAADIYKYLPLNKPSEKLRSEICFIGGYWQYKSKGIDRYMRPLTYPIGKYNVKIFGNSIWPYPQYCGTIDIHNEKTLYASSTICPNFYEPHTEKWGFEGNERIYQLAISKAFCLSSPNGYLDDIFTENELIIANDPEHMEDLVQMYLKSPELRLNSVDLCYNTVVKNHTYHERVGNLLEKLGFFEDSTRCGIIKEEFLNEV